MWRYHHPNGSDEHQFDIDSVQALQIATVIIMTVVMSFPALHIALICLWHMGMTPVIAHE